MRTFTRILCLSAALALPACRTHAGLPLPSLTFYGMLLDEFGWPYPADDFVEIYAGGVKVLTQSLSQSSGKGYNFLARVPYDSGGRMGDYSPDVITPGDVVSINLVDSGAGRTVISTNFVCNLAPGSVVNFNAGSGGDSLGDGLPDELRRWIWSALGDGSLFEPSKVKASDDSDGDGISNVNEFLAGTDPANPEDVLAVAISKLDNSNLAQLTYFSVPGKSYQVQSGQITSEGMIWSPTTFANSPGLNPGITEALGTGHLLTLFVGAADEASYYRVVIKPRQGGAVVIP